ncbi:MAG: glycine--tRNA ligase subunit beta [Gammaproteobacteria bacterium]|nr:glycine--tRNA ligase subunit beta [Gammaproteobacteria bacterium]
MEKHDFILELGTEELPPKLLRKLSNSLRDNLVTELENLGLEMGKVDCFATPRRLAVFIKQLQSKQKSQLIEKKGPAIGSPDKAVEGFAKSCGIDKINLEKQHFEGKEYYFYKTTKEGDKVIDLLPIVVKSAIKNIPITRAMQWGDSDYSFVRPVHWLVMMLDEKIIPTRIMGLTSGNKSRGLRFSNDPIIEISSAAKYQNTIKKKAKIEVNFDLRKELIRQQVIAIASDKNAEAVIDESLLEEVCALIEYPHAFLGNFDKKYLDVPEEAIISVMKSHQKYFHLVDKGNKLLPLFISVANIESNNMSVIVEGNERVIRPRLADAEFFWSQDRTKSLDQRLVDLKSVLFMKSLGSMADKAKRIEKLSSHIASKLNLDSEVCARAGLLSKSDLMTDMVGEFADLQGIMGGHYALYDGEEKKVAFAIRDQYLPRFSGDKLPSTDEGSVVAIADRLDSITGIYGIGNGPTGSKDPYALRRLALGLLRILVEKKQDLNLIELIDSSLNLHSKVVNRDISNEIYKFMMERLKAYYKESHVDGNVFEAVLAVSPESPLDFHLRIEALNEFIQHSESRSLIEANKRIANILKDCDDIGPKLNLKLLEEEAEKKLYQATQTITEKLKKEKDYRSIMSSLLALKEVIDDFFDNVMVNVKDTKLRQARLSLIERVRKLFLSVADISHLSS